jgi:hypothetical protein
MLCGHSYLPFRYQLISCLVLTENACSEDKQEQEAKLYILPSAAFRLLSFLILYIGSLQHCMF